VTTTPRSHHTVAAEAFARGWHAMVEKPMGLTVRACRLINQAAAGSGLVLSVAENYRRDPINRLGKALLQSGAIGDPRLMIHNTVGGGDKMTISMWRHDKKASGILLDVGTHYTDILEFYLGEATSLYAQTRLHEKVRHNPMSGREVDPAEATSPGGVYERWQKDFPPQFEATADDAGYATILFASGAVGQYVIDRAGHGQSIWQRAIFGSRGSLDLPGDRTGQRLRLHIDGDVMDDERLLEFVPDFHLDEVTAALFGGTRLYGYDFPFNETDRKLLAVEYAEFGDAILGKATVEVDGEAGTRAVALSYALMESQAAGRAVTMDEVMSDRTNAYQVEINESLGI
jgi:predicted dehydrogenase